MRTIVASLAAIVLAVAVAACGDEGAEPDAPGGGAPAEPINLVLDFQPNAVHTGIYVAQRREEFADRGLVVDIREPGASTDAPRLLRSGRADLAVLDIHDLAIAREAGADLVAVGAIVHEPLAAVIAADAEEIGEPADLLGKRIGVTGLPSDDAVLEAVLESGGLGLDEVETVTIGFEAVPALLNDRLDAATAFWNAEGVTLAGRLETREFRVADYGAPLYPELVLVTTPERLREDRASIGAAVEAIGVGYATTIEEPAGALSDLLAEVPTLRGPEQSAQLDALLPALRPSPALDPRTIERWARYDRRRGIVTEPIDIGAAFDFELAGPG